MKRRGVEFQAQREPGEVPWPFSCEFVVGRSSKLDEQAREGEEEELLGELDPQVAWVVLHRVARDHHTERDRVSYKRGDLRMRSERLGRGVPGGVKFSSGSVLGTQSKQGTQLTVELSEQCVNRGSTGLTVGHSASPLAVSQLHSKAYGPHLQETC